MATSSPATFKPIQLPSDQDSSGRTLGEEEIQLLSEQFTVGHSPAPKEIL